MSYLIFKPIKRPQTSGALLLFALTLFTGFEAHAGMFELSGSFSYSESKFGATSSQSTRRWGASIGYYFLALSEIELAIQDVMYRTRVSTTEDTTYHDKIYSANWVQSLAPRSYPVQPYLKVGVGQLNRDSSGSDVGTTVPAIYDSLTAIMGAGLRITIIRSISLKVEATTYLTGGLLSTWKNNSSIAGGVSVFF